jgi:hypothetical protein
MTPTLRRKHRAKSTRTRHPRGGVRMLANQANGVEILYLAAPYSHDDPKVRAWRYEMATTAAAHILAAGKNVFSPLTLTHPLDVALQREGKEVNSEYWVAFDEPYMAMCSGIVILKLDGWESSRGIAHEINFFASRKLPVYFMDASTCEITEATTSLSETERLGR